MRQPFLGNNSNVGPKPPCFQNISQQAQLRPTRNHKHVIPAPKVVPLGGSQSSVADLVSGRSRVVCRCSHGWTYTHMLSMDIADSLQE